MGIKDCCGWNPHNTTTHHCTACCKVFLDWRTRDYHFALEHVQEVRESVRDWKKGMKK